jgi:ABC-type polysaccharide/polyol phosphate transport system ATPase subunit
MIEKKGKRIILEGVSKTFNIGAGGPDTVLGKLINRVSGRESKKLLQVLHDISFDAYAGENIGIIGRNGSGKSTLLRLIAGIYKPDSGSVETNGKLMYMNGWSHGLKPRLTMRENIYLIGAIMGLTEKEVSKKFEEIVEFSGLKEFVGTKVYQFSSGMVTRLSFSIGIHCLHARNPDILLLDEILSAGGDAEFKNKASGKVEEFIKGGATVLFVSHNVKDIEKYCHRVIFLKKGVTNFIGAPAEAISLYTKDNV